MYVNNFKFDRCVLFSQHFFIVFFFFYYCAYNRFISAITTVGPQSCSRTLVVILGCTRAIYTHCTPYLLFLRPTKYRVNILFFFRFFFLLIFSELSLLFDRWRVIRTRVVTRDLQKKKKKPSEFTIALTHFEIA